MIIKPKTRGFICTTAHPVGCDRNVAEQISYVKTKEKIDGPKNVLVIGSSTGYGLASRISATFGCSADTIGVFFERKASGGRTATAGWYNNLALEKYAKAEGLVAESINGDAFSDEIKDKTIRLIKEKLHGKLDLIVYSLAAPRKTDPVTGQVYSSVLKPIGSAFSGKTVDSQTGIVSEVSIAPATEQEIHDTVEVMGGSDWLRWISALKNADLLNPNVLTLAYSYLGPEVTHAVYKDGTIGMAKEDLEKKCGEINSTLAEIGGKAYVSVNKALVTQASSAIPVVPLYIALLFKIMKRNGTHEGCIEQMYRMFAERLYQPSGTVPVDECGRIRMDDREMSPEIQNEITELWKIATSENINDISDLTAYRADFLRLFGFGRTDVDYDADVEV